jgi:hypothetical protein
MSMPIMVWLVTGRITVGVLQIYGEDYFYSKLYESASQLKFASRTDTIPVLNQSQFIDFLKKAWALLFYTKK